MQLLLLVYVNPLLAAIIPLCIIMVYTIQKHYLRVSRNLRYLDLHARAEVITNFIELVRTINVSFCNEH
jgi:ATP-binding cassette subfamily C (CFTR/MRP) protein 1